MCDGIHICSIMYYLDIDIHAVEYSLQFTYLAGSGYSVSSTLCT